MQLIQKKTILSSMMRTTVIQSSSWSKKAILFFYKLVFLIFLLLGTCLGQLQAHSKLKIVATTSIIGDALKNIVGKKAEIITLMGPGVDPHAYKATPKNIKDLSQATIIFYNGLHLEGKMAEVLAVLSKKKPVYAVSDGIEAINYLGDSTYQDGLDPHIWFDVMCWSKAVNYMCLKMIQHMPAWREKLEKNTTLYIAQLQELHQKIQKEIDQIPKNQRVLITAHDAFSYFGRAYEVEVKGLQGISTVEECGLRDITDLVNFIIQHKIKAIFPENSVPSKPLKAVVEGCRQKGHTVILAEELYSDALGEAGTFAGTYIGMISTNVKIIVDALK